MDYVKLHKHFLTASTTFESSERAKLSVQAKVMYWNEVIDSILEHNFTTREKLNAIKFLIFSVERTLSLHVESMEYGSSLSLRDDRQILSSMLADIQAHQGVKNDQTS
jgi:hypothetical protein